MAHMVRWTDEVIMPPTSTAAATLRHAASHNPASQNSKSVPG